MKFSEALERIQDGHAVRRAYWPTGNAIFMDKGSMEGAALEALRVADHDYCGVSHSFFSAGDSDTGNRLPILVHAGPYFKMPGWVPAQIDLFALDWEAA